MIYDLTKPLYEGMPVYPGHEPFRARTTHAVASDGFRLSSLSLGAHCGTHMDAPAHFIEGGETMEAAPLPLLMGRALVLTVRTAEELSGVPDGTERLFLRALFPGLAEADVSPLLKKGVRLLGTSAMAIGAPDCDPQAHRAFLGGGGWIVENLALDGVPDGWYHAVCLPMKLRGVEGAPARVVLYE